MLLTITNVFISARRSLLGPLCALACATAAASIAYAQQYTPPPPKLTAAPCVPTKKDPCDAPPAPPATAAPEKFPFPGDATAPVAPPSSEKFPFPGEPPAAPAASAPAQAQKFPFPEDSDPPSAPVPAASTSSSSSSSSSPASAGDDDSQPDSEKPALADKGSSGSTRAQRRNQPSKVQTPDQREAEDLDISHYYATTGNFKASYMRAQDAVKTIPDDPMAHFALAEAAGKLKQTDEAAAEYRLYLKLDPDGEKAKEARRALTELSPR